MKWIALVVLVLGGAWTARASHQHTGVIMVWAAAILILLSRFRITEQLFLLKIDRHAVEVSIYTDMSRRTWIRWTSGNASVRTCIREPYCTGWVDYELELHGKRYDLRILVKPIGDGYMISNYGRGFDMIVLRHTYGF